MSATFAGLRAALASVLLTAVLALGAVPGLSAQGQARSPWAFEYVQFATPSAGWAMAYKNGPNGFTELFTSHDEGRHWHDVTPPVVVAGENASFHNLLEPQTPFVLNSRDAWLPVLHDDGYGRYKVYVFMTSDAGRRWALRGRFPEDEVLGLFFLSPSTGFIETDDGAAMNGDPVQVYATSDGGKHWREASASPPVGAPGGHSTAIGDYCYKTGVSFASARVGFATGYCLAGPAYLQRTSDGGRKWAGIIIAPRNGDDGAATYPPVFSSPEDGSLVVEVGPVVLVATTTDAGRHWGLRHLPPLAERLLSADDFLPGCVDFVSARTWLVGAGHELFTTTDAGLSWRASPSPMALTNLQLDFLSPRVGWAYAGDVYGGWDARMFPLWRTTDGGRHWSTYSLAAP